ncbi:hypothetical protein CDAR_254751, partial [Caerostris darwini]
MSSSFSQIRCRCLTELYRQQQREAAKKRFQRALNDWKTRGPTPLLPEQQQQLKAPLVTHQQRSSESAQCEVTVTLPSNIPSPSE